MSLGQKQKNTVNTQWSWNMPDMYDRPLLMQNSNLVGYFVLGSIHIKCQTRKTRMTTNIWQSSTRKKVWQGNTMSGRALRACSLYSTVDDPADKLKIGPTRKKIDKSAFILFSPPTCHEAVLKSYIFPAKKVPKIPRNQWNLSNYLFFLSSDMNMQAYFIFFFSPTSLNNSVNRRI